MAALDSVHAFSGTVAHAAAPSTFGPRLFPAIVLLAGMLLLAGFAVGMAFEEANLRTREKRLADGRYRLANSVEAVAGTVRRSETDQQPAPACGTTPASDPPVSS